MRTLMRTCTQKKSEEEDGAHRCAANEGARRGRPQLCRTSVLANVWDLRQARFRRLSSRNCKLRRGLGYYAANAPVSRASASAAVDGVERGVGLGGGSLTKLAPAKLMKSKDQQICALSRPGSPEFLWLGGRLGRTPPRVCAAAPAALWTESRQLLASTPPGTDQFVFCFCLGFFFLCSALLEMK